ncbi:hypothetical protein XpopCFBP1817_14185 [Xanthomonas populi]|uniref:Uncharacterized protein n=1 Tax=Xanthomonas populi TaxID=53414 RepID=A0A2S7EM27_9XANT|nr:hypothetical protein XpopCFBP1817_14185 [Xanthomonas populi]
MPSPLAGPYAAWMPRKSLQGRTCGMSCDGGLARALQPQTADQPLLDLCFNATPESAPASRRHR